MTETQTAIQKARALLGDGRLYGGRTDNARLGPLKEALGPEVLTRYAQERSG